MDNGEAVNFDEDMRTISKYVSNVVEIKAKIAAVYTAALDNVQTTFQTASPAEARPDVLGVILKSGLKTAEKSAVTAVKESTGAGLDPLVDMLQGIADAVDSAAKAAVNRAVADWITDLRTSIVNAYAQSQTGADMQQQIEDEYKHNDEGGRGGYIGGIEIELEATRKIHYTVDTDDKTKKEIWLVPSSEKIELAMYESWINQNFNDDRHRPASVRPGRQRHLRNSHRSLRRPGRRPFKQHHAQCGRAATHGPKRREKSLPQHRMYVLRGQQHRPQGRAQRRHSRLLTSPDNWKQFTSFTT